MTLPSATLFPQALLPLYIFEPRYRKMLSDTLKSERMFSVAMQKPGRSRETPCLQGITRVELRETVQYKPYRIHNIRPLQPDTTDSVVIDALVAKVHELVRHRIQIGPCPFPFPLLKNTSEQKAKIAAEDPKFSTNDVLDYLENLSDADQVADLVSCALIPGHIERQTILETVELDKRLKHLIHFLMDEITRCEKGDGK